MKELVKKIKQGILWLYQELFVDPFKDFKEEQTNMKQAQKAKTQAKPILSQEAKRAGKFNDEDLKELDELVERNIKAFPMIRLGQSYFNCLYMKFPKIAEAVKGTEYDPFYMDSRIPLFKEYIKKFDK